MNRRNLSRGASVWGGFGAKPLYFLKDLYGEPATTILLFPTTFSLPPRGLLSSGFLSALYTQLADPMIVPSGALVSSDTPACSQAQRRSSFCLPQLDCRMFECLTGFKSDLHHIITSTTPSIRSTTSSAHGIASTTYGTHVPCPPQPPPQVTGRTYRALPPAHVA